jgi:hypothetical protein
VLDLVPFPDRPALASNAVVWEIVHPDPIDGSHPAEPDEHDEQDGTPDEASEVEWPSVRPVERCAFMPDSLPSAVFQAIDESGPHLPALALQRHVFRFLLDAPSCALRLTC